MDELVLDQIRQFIGQRRHKPAPIEARALSRLGKESIGRPVVDEETPENLELTFKTDTTHAEELAITAVDYLVKNQCV
ncbi:hypothetical protein [Bosea sp. 124]|uniref:hypothetical protein n=1 Tax=Bosea sp. 124 TaxID=2135642 RepID=UPI000D43C1EA|nr:hypothetical protein [Bosea sp. 124]PTM40342.1 hypothetical protein C8D03_1858 [Bosea sp. 124]